MVVQFNDLPRTVRERFVRITNATPLDPTILAHDYDVRTRRFGYVVALLALVVVPILAYALISQGMRDEPSYVTETYAAFAFAFYLLMTSWLGILYAAIWGLRPYREGSYVFGGCVVRTNGPKLGVVTIGEMTPPSLTHRTQNQRYVSSLLMVEGAMILFTEGKAAAEALERIVQARREYVTAFEQRDMATLQRLDPFFECTVLGQWKQPDNAPPLAREVPSGARLFRWLGSLLVSMAIAYGLYAVVDSAFAADRRALHEQGKKQKQQAQEDKE